MLVSVLSNGHEKKQSCQEESSRNRKLPRKLRREEEASERCGRNGRKKDEFRNRAGFRKARPLVQLTPA